MARKKGTTQTILNETYPLTTTTLSENAHLDTTGSYCYDLYLAVYLENILDDTATLNNHIKK